jgi:hypothetical protein
MTIDQQDPPELEDASQTAHDHALDIGDPWDLEDPDESFESDEEPRMGPEPRACPREPLSQTRTRNGIAIAIVSVYLALAVALATMGVVQGNTDVVEDALRALWPLAIAVPGFYLAVKIKR